MLRTRSLALTYSGGTFSGGTLASAGTLSQQYGFADHIIDGVDASGMGLVRTEANNVYVTPHSYSSDVGTYSPSIQRGIDAATAGDTVNVEAGTYTGDVNIDKSVTLSGAEAGVDPGATGWTAPASTIMGAGINAPIAISSGIDNVAIDGFAIESPPAGSGSENAGIWMNGSTGVTIDYNVIENNTTGIAIADAGGSITHNLIQDNNAPGAGFGNGIEFFAGSSGDWTISKNHFTNNQGADIGIVGGGDTVSNVTITDNDFFASAGIFLITSANTLVEDNAFSDSLGDAIDLAGGNNGVTITQNRITDPVGSGINVIGDVYGLGGSGGGPDLNVSISHNKVTGAGTAGISISQGSVAIDDNTLTGDVVGVLAEAFYEDPGYYSGTIDATLDGNTITGNTAAGIVAGSAQTTAPIYLLAQNNTITGDGEGVVISNGATVDLGTDVTDTVHQDFSGLGTTPATIFSPATPGSAAITPSTIRTRSAAVSPTCWPRTIISDHTRPAIPARLDRSSTIALTIPA